jgi:hypothetical protein
MMFFISLFTSCWFTLKSVSSQPKLFRSNFTTNSSDINKTRWWCTWWSAISSFLFPAKKSADSSWTFSLSREPQLGLKLFRFCFSRRFFLQLRSGASTVAIDRRRVGFYDRVCKTLILN